MTAATVNIDDINIVVDQALEGQLQEMQDQLNAVKSYVSTAQSIDDQVIAKVDHSVPLDDLPYGEELMRLDPLPEQLESHIQKLENITESTTAEKIVVIEEGAALLIEASSELAECSDLPATDDDDD
ncbi:MAG: hypothetical protein HAW67_02940 [Endozoicomonadaceae bacterium]|nr:hypothetical protein [Endozoicomonadaceae bacterium]